MCFSFTLQKVGVSEHVITMHTGADDMSRLGQITNFNGADDQGVWGSAECNRIEGSDGSQFPPPHVSPQARLYVYNRDMCRRLPLVFKDYTEAQGMDAYRFHMPHDVFSNHRDNPENKCFCHSDDPAKCLPSGVFNTTSCNYGEACSTFSHPHVSKSQVNDKTSRSKQPFVRLKRRYLSTYVSTKIEWKYGIRLNSW